MGVNLERQVQVLWIWTCLCLHALTVGPVDVHIPPSGVAQSGNYLPPF